MKKLLLLGAFVCSFAVSFAQPAKICKEEARFICAQIMANFTESLQSYYKEGMSFDEFRNGLVGDAHPTKEAKALLLNSFEMLVNKTDRDVILRTYQGKEVAMGLQNLYDLHEKGIASEGAEFFGLTSGKQYETRESEGSKCRWFDLFCHAKDFLNWVIDNWSTIQQIILFISGL